MRFKKSINVLITLLISATILIIHFWTFLAGMERKAFSYGDIAPDFYAEDINGNLFVLSEEKGKSLFILFFDPLYISDKFKLAYAEVLFKRYKNNGFKVIGVSNKDKITTRKFSMKCELSFPVIADEDKKIHKLFKIDNCCGGFVLLNKGGKIEFYSKSLISEEEMRQLVEKSILGKINYIFEKPSEQTIFIKGKEVPDLILYNVRKNKKISLRDFSRENNIVLTIFHLFVACARPGKELIP